MESRKYRVTDYLLVSATAIQSVSQHTVALQYAIWVYSKSLPQYFYVKKMIVTFNNFGMKYKVFSSLVAYC